MGLNNMISFKIVLGLAAVISLIGMAGLLLRKNLVIMLMCLEMMILGGVMALIAAARYHSVVVGVSEGALFVPFILVIAAGEVCVGLSLVMQIFKTQKTLWVDEIDGPKEGDE